MNDSWNPYAQAIAASSARSERVIVSEADLRKFCTAMLVAYGVPRDDADLTVDVFVQSDLRGEESHGIRLLLQVLYRIKAGGD